MTDISKGKTVYGVDMPPAVYDQDWTQQSNLASASYSTGAPEVGVNFVAPSSGRVLVCIGCGIRDNSTTVEGGVVTYILYEDSANGVVVTAAAADHGVASQRAALAEEFHYVGGFNMEEGLTPGKNYYAQMVHRRVNASATTDIASRDIAVIPLT
jgi:hypothetical protein